MDGRGSPKSRLFERNETVCRFVCVDLSRARRWSGKRVGQVWLDDAGRSSCRGRRGEDHLGAVHGTSRRWGAGSGAIDLDAVVLAPAAGESKLGKRAGTSRLIETSRLFRAITGVLGRLDLQAGMCMKRTEHLI